MDNIHCKLSRMLGDKRITQVELAERTGLSTRTINQLYNDKWQGINKNTMLKLCRALGITPGELFEYVPEISE